MTHSLAEPNSDSRFKRPLLRNVRVTGAVSWQLIKRVGGKRIVVRSIECMTVDHACRSRVVERPDRCNFR